MSGKKYLNREDLQYFPPEEDAVFMRIYSGYIEGLHLQKFLQVNNSPLYDKKRQESCEEEEEFLFYTFTENPDRFHRDEWMKARKEGEAAAKRKIKYYQEHKEFCDKEGYIYIPY